MKKLLIFITLLYSCQLLKAQPPCGTNWLFLPQNPTTNDFVSVGDVNLAGTPNQPRNTLTIEASFFCGVNFTQGGINSVNLVSKHETPTQGRCNYLLRTVRGEIQTTNNFYVTSPNGNIPDFIPNRINHVAMVYNGTTLSFYRNGCLVSSAPATGDIENDSTLLTRIGYNSGTTFASEPFRGYINEVKIWNTARTLAQIQANMNTPLPNPQIQAGLVAYYRFSSLTNLQGNATFNGTIFGNATFNNTPTNCNFTAGPCIPVCPSNTNTSTNKCSNLSTNLNARAGTTYSWSPSTGLSSTTVQNPICTATTNTTYTVTVFNAANNCTNIDVVNVVVNPAVISNIKDTFMCKRDSVRLNAPSGYSYSWSPAINISNSSVFNPIVSPAVTTNYVVTITNSAGCITRDTVLVTVNDCGCEDSCNWSLTGNTFVKPYNFIGSKNNEDFKIRTNNTQRMVVTAGGNIGLNTTSPAKTLDVNGEAVVRNLPQAAVNDRLVLANNLGELKSLLPGAPNQFLAGNGTWQTVPTSGGTVTDASQGVTLDGSTVLLGDYCSKGGGGFKSDREVNMEDFNLYFNSSYRGKVRIGNNQGKEKFCPELQARLELDTRGLKAVNDYVSPQPSLSGLRFVDLTATSPTIENKYKGVLSLDEDGDIIWVDACCNQLGKDNQIASILERLDKLENELKAVKSENTILKSKLNVTEVVLENKLNVLEQNVPNPFNENTTIKYNIENSFSKATMVFYAENGQLIKSVNIPSSGKGEIKLSANLIAKGIYTYSLIVDNKLIETKKMVKQ
jgi:Concanavalin A-like lectin/glucanases superfamily